MRIKSLRKLATYILTLSMVLFSLSSAFALEANTLTAPTDLNIQVGDSKLNLSWSEVEGATHYNIYQSLDNQVFEMVSIPGTVVEANYKVTDLNNGSLYYFNISAENSNTESQLSEVISQTPMIQIQAVNLGGAGDYAILAKSGISSVPNSVITGDIGVSPITSTAITGFSLTMDASNQFSSSTQVIGKVHAPDYTSPTGSNLTSAVSDMETAYVDAAGRAPNYTELYSGDISGKTLTAGVYKWGTGVLINSDITLTGGPDDVWIFQIAKGMTQAANTRIILAGGAQAKNIFWQTADAVSIGTGAHFEGIVLGKTNIALGSGASINGRLLAQTAVTLITNTIVAPSEGVSDIPGESNEFETSENITIQTLN